MDFDQNCMCYSSTHFHPTYYTDTWLGHCGWWGGGIRWSTCEKRKRHSTPCIDMTCGTGLYCTRRPKKEIKLWNWIPSFMYPAMQTGGRSGAATVAEGHLRGPLCFTLDFCIYQCHWWCCSAGAAPFPLSWDCSSGGITWMLINCWSVFNLSAANDLI